MIKTKLIETLKAKILIIGGLPEDAREIEARPTLLRYVINNYIKFIEVFMPPGKWHPVGFLKDISEEEANGLVECLTPGHFISLWMNYKYDKPLPVGFTCNTAAESMHSLVEANCKLKNGYGERPVGIYHNQGDTVIAEKVVNAYKSAWQAEQEQVFVNPYILKMID